MTRQRLSIALKGKKRSSESKRHMSESKRRKPAVNKGRRYINKDCIGKIFKLTDLQNYLNNGWTFGRPKKVNLVTNII